MATSTSDPLALFYHAVNPMLVVDDNRRYIAVNDAACSLLKRRRDELVGATIDSITPQEYHNQMRDVWANFIQAGSLCGSYQVVDGEGQRVDVRFNSTANVLPGRHLTIFVVDNKPVAAADDETAQLSPREIQIINLIAAGNRGSEVADKLGLSPDTVRVHIRNAMRKLQARTRAHAVAIAIRQGLVTVDDN